MQTHVCVVTLHTRKKANQFASDKQKTKRRGRVVKTHASYSGGPSSNLAPETGYTY